MKFKKLTQATVNIFNASTLCELMSGKIDVERMDL